MNEIIRMLSTKCTKQGVLGSKKNKAHDVRLGDRKIEGSDFVASLVHEDPFVGIAASHVKNSLPLPATDSIPFSSSPSIADGRKTHDRGNDNCQGIACPCPAANSRDEGSQFRQEAVLYEERQASDTEATFTLSAAQIPDINSDKVKAQEAHLTT
ncbi:hypothetical protein BX600DRAFT_430617 [Xylariales sp. PMI_506]|nr:hypothetical protein BX600DRAFT_430617 [Xylariales sp. PMI_506]